MEGTFSSCLPRGAAETSQVQGIFSRLFQEKNKKFTVSHLTPLGFFLLFLWHMQILPHPWAQMQLWASLLPGAPSWLRRSSWAEGEFVSTLSNSPSSLKEQLNHLTQHDLGKCSTSGNYLQVIYVFQGNICEGLMEDHAMVNLRRFFRYAWPRINTFPKPDYTTVL